MTRGEYIKRYLQAILVLLALSTSSGQAQPAAPVTPAGESPRELLLTTGKSLLVSSSLPIERVSVGLGDLAEATVISPLEILLNGKAPGQTSLILWQRGGGKLFFNVSVQPDRSAFTSRVHAIERELQRELPGQTVGISVENDTIFLRGRVKDLISAERAMRIASTLGPTVNLLYVDVPDVEPQILLRVRFASVDRSASLQLGLNLISAGAGNTIGSTSTQQFTSPQVANKTSGPGLTLSDALNVFLFRPDLKLGAAIQALRQDSLMEILAEPNVLAMNGKKASFLAGGEFPFPSFQPNAGGVGTVTVQFREFGIRLNFIPTVTARGTIRLQVSPEVSALNFTGGLVVQGFTIPALTVRKVSTEIELAPGQSFAIGGLIDNQITETIEKIPLLGEIPVLGRFFQSKFRLRNNTELLVMVTPELVDPVDAGTPTPAAHFPKSPSWPPVVPNGTGVPSAPLTPRESVPVETLVHSSDAEATAAPKPASPSAEKSPPPSPSRN